MKVKQPGTNIMAIIFVPGTIHHYLNLRQILINIMVIILVPAILNKIKVMQVRANIMVVIFIPGSLINESNAF